MFLGYPEGVKCYKLWCLNFNKIIVGRDFIFDESLTILVLNMKNSNEILTTSSITNQLKVEHVNSHETDVITPIPMPKPSDTTM